MTKTLEASAVAERLQGVAGGVTASTGGEIRVEAESLVAVCRYLKETPDLAMDYLSSHHRRRLPGIL